MAVIVMKQSRGNRAVGIAPSQLVQENSFLNFWIHDMNTQRNSISYPSGAILRTERQTGELSIEMMASEVVELCFSRPIM
jgi:hypothetical protein